MDSSLDQESRPLKASETSSVESFARRQPLLAMSGIGSAIGTTAAFIRKISRNSLAKSLKYPKLYKYLPKYLRSNYVKYPALCILLLASTRRIRYMLSN